ncbi:MAG TPA: tetratricopeptide repeat protein, partial [Thermoanaerobaculia bacterium]|nr:tetratricopeptide repeat protein [Thermoanaerobaculia bacterium]
MTTLRRLLLIVPLLVLILGASTPEAEAKTSAVSLTDLWSQAVGQARGGELEPATETLDRLVSQGAATGVERFPPFAEAAASMAIEAAASGNGDLESWATTAARRLDARSAEAHLALADAARQRGDWGKALQRLFRAIPRVFTNYENAVVARADLLIGIVLAIALAIAVFSLTLLMRYGKPAAHDFRERLSRLGPGGSTVLGFALLFLPIFLWLGPVWLMLYWFILFFTYAGSSERALIVVCLVLIAFHPIPLDWASSRLAGIETPVVKAAVAMAERSYEPDATRRVREVIALMPEEPLLHLQLGDLLIQEGADQEALIHYQRAVELAPTLASGQLNLGNVYFLGGDFAAASVRYER